MNKSNKVELDKRILIISKLLLSGKVNKVIFRYASLNWGVSDRQTQNYIKACYALWFKEFKVKHLANVSYHLAKRADLYCQAYKQKDWRTCLEISKEESKILDIYPSEKHELLVEKKPEIDYSYIDDVLMKLKKEDLEKLIAIFNDRSEEEILKALGKVTGKQKLLKKGEIQNV